MSERPRTDGAGNIVGATGPEDSFYPSPTVTLKPAPAH